MALAANFGTPAQLVIYPIYLGFYVLPGDSPLPVGVVRVDCYRAMSPDGIDWGTPTLLASGDNEVGFYVVDSNLDPSTQYAYCYDYIFVDGSTTGKSPLAVAGLAELIVTTSINVDNLAKTAFSIGLVTSGVFEGVEFRTAATPPMVQMDPRGLWALNSQGAYLVNIDVANDLAYFSGQVQALGLDLPPSSSTDPLDASAANKIIWPSPTVSGENAAQIVGTAYGASGAETDTLALYANPSGLASGSAVIIGAGGAGDAYLAEIYLYVDAGLDEGAIQLIGGAAAGSLTELNIGPDYMNAGATGGGAGHNIIYADTGSATVPQASDFVRNVVTGTYQHRQVWDIVSNTISIGPGSDASFTVTNSAWNLTAGFFIDHVELFNNGGGYMDWCSWGLISYTGTSVTISVVNHSPTNTATGSYFHYVETWF